MRGVSPTGMARKMSPDPQMSSTEGLDPPLQTEDAIIKYFSSKVANSLLELRKREEKATYIPLQTLEKRFTNAVVEKVAMPCPALEDRISDSQSKRTPLAVQIGVNEQATVAGPSNSQGAASGLMHRAGVTLTDRIAESGIEAPPDKRKRRRLKTKKHRGGRKIREKKMQEAGLMRDNKDGNSTLEDSD
ncbi:hypothetical protein DXG01_011644 [Tephrocybe rancida]|nr:hypothetical protein DXG01_011644 [Tephrocybe rancida]